ncbi:MAG: indole-3-glycerol phosphate synthase TrpC [Melioribacteraceae bacterium]|nr:indole-3-glycerol phosphate synthase TrpC [Melioribacteraceae bacterium]
MSDILTEIVEVKKEEVKILKRDFTISRFSDFEFFNSTCLSFSDALSKPDRISIIAEVKKASPSKGIIREDFNHRTIADIYLNNGADAISVLTDKQFFKGNISYLNDIANEKAVPLLRKDFIIDEYQVYEAKANGADAILLIAEILSANQIFELSKAAYELRISVLLEMHNEKEISKIDFSLNKIIGINNRDLSNFKTDIRTTEIISNKLPDNIILVSESGINSKENIDYLKTINTDAVLVGEHFMRADNIGNSLKEMKEFCEKEVSL